MKRTRDVRRCGHESKDDARAEDDRIGAHLKDEQTRGETIAGDLRREKEVNMRLQMLVSDRKK
jgi:hypothetical protein